MYVITAHQRHRQTDGQTDVKRSHDRYIAKACSGKNGTWFIKVFKCCAYGLCYIHYCQTFTLNVWRSFVLPLIRSLYNDNNESAGSLHEFITFVNFCRLCSWNVNNDCNNSGNNDDNQRINFTVFSLSWQHTRRQRWYAVPNVIQLTPYQYYTITIQYFIFYFFFCFF